MTIEACIFLLLLSTLSKVIKVSCLVQADNKKGRMSFCNCASEIVQITGLDWK